MGQTQTGIKAHTFAFFLPFFAEEKEAMLRLSLHRTARELSREDGHRRGICRAVSGVARWPGTSFKQSKAKIK
jgi:hypothetical protein